MFTLRQIAFAGFLGVYSGCLPITVNLARIPYQRGTIIGVFFGALTHMMTTLLYILAATTLGGIMQDPILQNTSTWIAIASAILFIQLCSAVGCYIMGTYFLAPKRKSDPFDRKKLYQNLKSIDLQFNPEDGSKSKRSVLHDVVLCLENHPPYPDARYSSAWILLFGFLSLASMLFWIRALNIACLQVLFLDITADFSWYFSLSMQILIPFIFLILAHFSTLAWICRDKPSRAE